MLGPFLVVLVARMQGDGAQAQIPRKEIKIKINKKEGVGRAGVRGETQMQVAGLLRKIVDGLAIRPGPLGEGRFKSVI